MYLTRVIRSVFFFFWHTLIASEKKKNKCIVNILLSILHRSASSFFSNWWWPRHLHEDLEAVVNEPLHGGQRPYHYDPGPQSLPESLEADLPRNFTRVRPLLLVQFTDDSICRVTDNRTKHTGYVTGGKCHHELFPFRTLRTWLWNDVKVQHFQRFLKASELHHRVRDLT